MTALLVDAVGIYFLIGILWVCALSVKYHMVEDDRRDFLEMFCIKALGLLVGWFPWCCYLVYRCLTKKKGP